MIQKPEQKKVFDFNRGYTDEEGLILFNKNSKSSFAIFIIVC